MLADLVPARRSWTPGAVVSLRHVLAGRTWCLLPVTVLLDSPVVTVVRISAGSRWHAAVDAGGVRAHTWERQWTLASTTWAGDDCTYAVRPGRWAAVGWCAPADGSGEGRFYVNGQRPVRFVPSGLETLDLELDAELYPPAFEPRWKDRDRFDRAVREGVVSLADADLLLADMRAAVDELPAGPDAALLAQLSRAVVVPAQLPDVAAGAPTDEPTKE